MIVDFLSKLFRKSPPELGIIDSQFPQKHPFGFRNFEINGLLSLFPRATAFAMFRMYPEKDAWFHHGYGTGKKAFEENLKSYLKVYPENKGRVKRLPKRIKRSIYGASGISVGNNVRIDDFSVLSGNITVGDYVHISAYAALYGKNGIRIGNFCGVSPRSTVFSATDDFSREWIDILKGMPSDLMNLAYQVRKNAKRFPKVLKIFSDSEVLDDFSRNYVAETFGAPVLDFYGSVENGCIAFQMNGSDKYFINETQVLLEGLNGGTEQDDAIITNLRNTTFPIIRYQIGDMIDFGDGKSNLKNITVRTIDRIYGKYLDFIILPDKTIVSPHVPKQEVTHDLAGVRKFQIIQTDFDRVTVKIERDDDYVPETEKTIIDRLTKAFKNQIVCTVEYDDTLSVKTKNKFKCISSAVAQTFLSDKP